MRSPVAELRFERERNIARKREREKEIEMEREKEQLKPWRALDLIKDALCAHWELVSMCASLRDEENTAGREAEVGGDTRR